MRRFPLFRWVRRWEYEGLMSAIFSTKLFVTSSARGFRLVEESGPGVLVLQVAISDAQSATPVLRSVTMVVPQARALGTLKYLATGTYPFVGVAQAEGRLFDGGTGMTLEAWVDTRVGGGNVSTAVQWQWRMSRMS